MKICYIYTDRAHEWNSAEWRCAIPARALRATGKHDVRMVPYQALADHWGEISYALEDADLAIIQRTAMPDAWRAVEWYRRRGVVFVSDIDDGYPQIPPSHPAYDVWHRGMVRDPMTGQTQRLPRPGIQDLRDGIAFVGRLISPSVMVLEDWRDAAPIRRLVPNYVPTQIYTRHARRSLERRQDGTILIGWGGSAGHMQSWHSSGVAEGLTRILTRHPMTRLVVYCADPRVAQRVTVQQHRRIQINWRPLNEWPARLALLDIGLIPAWGDFDARRSLLKPIEYSLMRIPWIASKAPPYDGLGDYGVLVENTPTDWADALQNLIAHGADEKRLRRAYEWAMSYDIGRNLRRLIDDYTCIRDAVIPTPDQRAGANGAGADGAGT